MKGYDITVNGHYHDGAPIEGYLCRVSPDHEEMLDDDDRYFFYFVGERDIVGVHVDFTVTDFERV